MLSPSVILHIILIDNVYKMRSLTEPKLINSWASWPMNSGDLSGPHPPSNWDYRHRLPVLAFMWVVEIQTQGFMPAHTTEQPSPSPQIIFSLLSWSSSLSTLDTRPLSEIIPSLFLWTIFFHLSLNTLWMLSFEAKILILELNCKCYFKYIIRSYKKHKLFPAECHPGAASGNAGKTRHTSQGWACAALARRPGLCSSPRGPRVGQV